MFLNHHLKKGNAEGMVIYSRYFIKKINNLVSISENAILLKADMMGLHQSTPYDVGLTGLAGALD